MTALRKPQIITSPEEKDSRILKNGRSLLREKLTSAHSIKILQWGGTLLLVGEGNGKSLKAKFPTLHSDLCRVVVMKSGNRRLLFYSL